MEANSRSYQDAICGAFVAALCYVKARHRHQEQESPHDHQHESSLDTSSSLSSPCWSPSSSTSSSSSSPSRSSSKSHRAVTASLPRASSAKPRPILVAEPLSTDWTQLEVIDLINDGTGLGFGIIGGRSTGVVIKTVLPGGIADQDGHLRTGDHILQIGDINVRGMSSEQVALVLRQSGPHVRLVVARSVLEPPQFQTPHAPIIPTHQLEQHMEHFNAVMAMEAGEHELHLHNLYLQHQLQQYQLQQQQHQPLLGSVQVHPQPLEAMQEMASVDVFEVNLMKDSTGLGITIAGYVGGESTPDDISGIFVKSVTDEGPADVDARIHVNDQIIEVDGMSLQGFSNQQAVEVLRNTGQMVRLKLVRFRHGPKFEKLQEYLANQYVMAQSGQAKEITTFPYISFDPQENQPVKDDYCGEIPSEIEAAIKAAWEPIVGNDFLVVVAQLSKFKEAGGLGISLEGTVDVEDGVEVRPHHYIRSILPDGPVGLNRRLKSNDELLEVNGKRLLGLNHVSVVDVLKDLPQHVRLVCARRKCPLPDSFLQPDMHIHKTTDCAPGAEPMQLWTERLVKAKSEVALSTSESTAPGSLNKPRSRSLEPMTGMALWSSQYVVIELHKEERGLGFSVLDYQDPVNPDETVIVIGSLVPGGVAQIDGHLVPGDRLIFVNNVNLEQANQVEAVQALKGAPRGIVKIGVAKPLPLTEVLKMNSKISSVVDATLPPFSKYFTGTKVLLPPHDPAMRRSFENNSAFKLHSKTELPLSASRTGNIQSEQQLTDKCASVFTDDHKKAMLSLEEFGDSVDDVCLNPRQSASSVRHFVAFRDSSSGVGGIKYNTEVMNGFSKNNEEIKTCSRESSAGNVKGEPINRTMIPYRSTAGPIFDDVFDHAKGLGAVAEVKNFHAGEIKDYDPCQILWHDSVNYGILSNASAALDKHQNKVLTGKNVTYLPTIVKSDDETNGNVVLPRGRRAADLQDQNATSHTEPPTTTSLKKSAEPNQGGVTESDTLAILAPIAKLDSTEFESDQERPMPLPAISPPPFMTVPTPPLTPPLRPAPCSPKREPQIHGRSGYRHRKTSSTSSTDCMTSSDLKTPTSSPRGFYSGLSCFTSPELTRVPPSLERTVHIHKSNLHLGLTVDAIDSGVNGCVVKSIAKPSCVDKDGRVRPGDYIVAINNESLRRITNSQARAIFRRSSLIGSDITITYIPGQAVDKTNQQTEEPVSESKHHPQKLDQPLKSEDATVSLATEQPQTCIKAAAAADISPARQSLPSEAKPGAISGQKTLQTDGSFAVGNQNWGPPRIVQLIREAGKSLGISIVGGRVDICNVSQEHSNAGIFIKQVLSDSPAGRNGTLKKGDCILEVNGCDVRNATHDEAVDVIRNSSCPITFLVQSLSYSSCPKDPESSSPARTVQSFKKSLIESQSSIPSSPEHTQDQQDDVKMAELFTDNESEDEFSYIKKRIQKQYPDLQGTVQLVDLNRGSSGMGLGLCGNKDRSKMSVFIAGIQPDSPAARDGRIQVGDEILEVNGVSLHGLSHLNASAIMKSIIIPEMKLVIHRSADFLTHMAVKPLRYSGSTHSNIQSPRGSADTTSSNNSQQESSATSYSHSSGATGAATSPSSAQPLTPADTIQVITLHKSNAQGLGFGIHEDTVNGRHGIYIISITHGGVAEKGQQLEVGDEILEVTDKSFVGLPYDQAIDFLRSAQGSVKLKVRKANPIHSSLTTSPTSPNNPQGKIQLLNTFGESSTDHADSTDTGDPKTCPIALGRRTYIEIEKRKMRLGLGIVGGSDTLLLAIIIHEVFDGGAVAKDGRLQSGDQLLEVNGEDLTHATHVQALQTLNQTPSVIKMEVYRDESWTQEKAILDVFSVDLVRRPGKGLGLSIMGGKYGTGIYISDVVKGGNAEADGRLMHGDQILAVNGQDFKNSAHEHGLTVLKTVLGKVSLSVGRLKASSRVSSKNSCNHGTSLKKSDSSTSSRSKIRHSKSTSEDHSHPQSVEITQEILKPLSTSLDCQMCSSTEDVPIIAASPRLREPGVTSGILKAGDRSLSINGTSTENMLHEQVISPFRSSNKGELNVIKGNRGWETVIAALVVRYLAQ